MPSDADGGIHHVGSTSVRGLDANPVIDLFVRVPDLESSRECFELPGRRADADCATRYAALKRRLARELADDRDGYTRAKGDFIRAVLADGRALP